jgi:hypothetical protein
MKFTKQVSEYIFHTKLYSDLFSGLGDETLDRTQEDMLCVYYVQWMQKIHKNYKKFWEKYNAFKANKIYILIIIQFRHLFLHITSTGTGSNYIQFDQYNLNVLHLPNGFKC